jgi:class 3 adenylate cyclase
VDRLNLHPATLAFRDPEVERAYLDHHAAATRGDYRHVVALSGILWILFGIWDWVVLPDHRETLWKMRYAVTPAHVLAYAFSYAPFHVFRRHWQEVSVALNLVGGLGVVAMQIAVPEVTPYAYFGVCVINLVAHTLGRIRFFAASLSCLAIVAAYVVVVAIQGADTRHMVNSLTWLVLANAIGMFSSYTVETYRRRDFAQSRALEREKQKSELLLLNILPEPIAERLKNDAGSIAEGFEHVSVLFADIVGFTQLTQRMPPRQLVALLNDVFSEFDEAAERLGLEKIKTIGDAYMVVGGLPTPRADHAHAIADMALEMNAIVGRHGLEMRIGINSGPVVAGVIGKRKYIYDLWGDTVNVASRMEALGVAGGIQVTTATRALLEDAYLLEERGTVDVKGKGAMPVHLLKARRTAEPRVAASSA